MVNRSLLYRTALACLLAVALVAPPIYGGPTTAYDLQLAVDATPAPAVAGAQITVLLVVTNGGPDPALETVLEIATPDGATYDSASTTAAIEQEPSPGGTGTLRCRLAEPLDAEGTVEVEAVFNVVGEPGTVLAFEASTSANDPELDSNPENNTASLEVPIVESSLADVAVEVSPYGKEAGSGAPFAFAVDITNVSEGKEPARGVEVTIEIPAGSVFSSVSDFEGNCTAPEPGGAGAVVCAFDELFPSDVISIDVEVDVVAAPGATLEIVASATSASEDPDESNNEAAAAVPVVPGPPAELDWEEPDPESTLDFPPPRNLIAGDDGKRFGGGAGRRTTVIGYNIYGSSQPNVMPSPATFITSVGPTATAASVTAAPSGTFFVVTAVYEMGESGPSNEASA